MAIPIAEIPNAPQIGPDPAMIEVRNANTDLSGAARMLNAEQIRQGSFDGAAEGLQAIGQAGQQVAGVLSHLSGVMAEAQNTASLAKAEGILSEAFAAHEMESATKDPNQWVSSWQAKKDKIMAGMKDLPLTPGGKRQMDLFTSQFWGKSTIELGGKANKQIIEDSRLAVKTSFQRYMGRGQYEAGADIINKAVDDGLISKPERDAMLLEAENNQMDDILAKDMNDDPEKFINNVAAGFYDVPQQRGFALIHQADQIIKRREVETTEQGDELVLTGSLKTEEEIREWAKEQEKQGRKIPEKNLLSLVKSLSLVNDSTEAGQAAIQAVRGEVYEMISSFDPETDVKNENYFKITDTIRTKLPAGYREELLKEVSDIRKEAKKTPARQIRSEIDSQIIMLRNEDFFGNFTEGNIDSKLAAAQKANALQTQFREYQKQIGPKLTQADADTWLASQVSGDAKKAVRNNAFARPVPPQPPNMGFGASIVPRKQKSASELAAEIDSELQLPTE